MLLKNSNETTGNRTRDVPYITASVSKLKKKTSTYFCHIILRLTLRKCVFFFDNSVLVLQRRTYGHRDFNVGCADMQPQLK